MIVTIMIFVILSFLVLTAIHSKLSQIHEAIVQSSIPWPKREGL